MYRLKSCAVTFSAVTLIIAAAVQASNDTNGRNGINSADLPLNGSAISIGQVEYQRPGKFGFDDGAHSNVGTVPEQVSIDDGGAPTANANNEIIDPGPPPVAHATQVAGVIISNDPFAPGVATEADLYASGVPVRTRDNLSLAAQYIAERDNDEVRAINLSFVIPFQAGHTADGNSPFTLFIDWSAKEHDTLYVVANRNTFTFPPEAAEPTDNYNGMTVAASTKANGVYRQVAAFVDLSADAQFARTSISILAPGDDVEVADIGGPIPPTRTQGSSFAAPHVTGTVALLQQFAKQRIDAGAARWDEESAVRHEVMKAVLMNSADKLIDNGTAMLPGQMNPIPQGNLLGMERTVLRKNGSSTWFNSNAFAGANFEESLWISKWEPAT
jgi:hypothetical protein